MEAQLCSPIFSPGNETPPPQFKVGSFIDCLVGSRCRGAVCLSLQQDHGRDLLLGHQRFHRRLRHGGWHLGGTHNEQFHSRLEHFLSGLKFTLRHHHHNDLGCPEFRHGIGWAGHRHGNGGRFAQCGLDYIWLGLRQYHAWWRQSNDHARLNTDNYGR